MKHNSSHRSSHNSSESSLTPNSIKSNSNNTNQSNAHHANTHHSKSQSFDFESVASSWYVRLFIILLFLTIGLSVAYQTRSGQVDFDGLADVVEANIYAQVRQQVRAQIDSQYPISPETFKAQLTDKEFSRIVDAGGLQIGNQFVSLDDVVQSNLKGVKANFQTPDGQTYLGSIDPYYYYYLGNNLYKNGHTGDRLNEAGMPWIDKFLSPAGSGGAFKPEFNIWLVAKTYAVLGLPTDASDSVRFKAIFLLPVFLSMIAIFPTYFILRRLSNDLYALLGSLICVTTGIFVSRTLAGAIDNDPYYVIVPLVIYCFFVLALLEKRLWLAITLSALAGVAQGFFAWTLGNPWFSFLFILAAGIMYIGYLAIDGWITGKIKQIIELVKRDVILLGVYVLSGYIFQYIIVGNSLFGTTIAGIFGGIRGISSFDATNIWPNVLSSVAELNPSSFGQIIASVGGYTIFLLGLLGLVLLSLNFEWKAKVSSSISPIMPWIKWAIYLSSVGLFLTHIQLEYKFIISISTSFILVGIISKLIYGLLIFLPILILAIALYNDNWSHSLISFSLIWFNAIIFGNLFSELTANSKLLFLVLLFIPVGISLIFALWNNYVDSTVAVTILLSVWMAGTIYMSFNGVRFIMLLGPAFAIAFSLALYFIAKNINALFFEYLGFTHILAKYLVGTLVALIIFFSVFAPMYNDAMSMSSQPAILFDRAWFDAMAVVRAQTAPDAIITSWWDFGHFFRAIGERGVTFDGASQTTPQAHWVGRLLMENNETVARDMLRMLVCGGNGAFEVMQNYSQDKTGGILVNKLIYQTFNVPSLSQKEALLQDNAYFNFTSEQASRIMTVLACEKPRESIFVTSGDMVGKASVWAHWGSWDFTKKYVFDNYKSQSVQVIASALHETPTLISQYVNELNQLTVLSRTQNIKYTDLVNQWFAPYPGYYPGTNGNFASCKEKDNAITCDNSVSFVRGVSTFNITSNLQAPPIGRVLFVQSDGKTKTYDRTGSFAPGSVVMDAVFTQTDAASYSLLLAQTPLGGSLFSRIFFFDGKNSKYFEPIGAFGSQTQGKISIWKTNWSID